MIQAPAFSKRGNIEELVWLMDVKDGEVELMRRGDMELRSDMPDPMVPIAAASTAGLSWVDRDENVKVSLTTHRLVFFKESSVVPLFLFPFSSPLLFPFPFCGFFVLVAEVLRALGCWVLVGFGRRTFCG